MEIVDWNIMYCSIFLSSDSSWSDFVILIRDYRGKTEKDSFWTAAVCTEDAMFTKCLPFWSDRVNHCPAVVSECCTRSICHCLRWQSYWIDNFIFLLLFLPTVCSFLAITTTCIIFKQTCFSFEFLQEHRSE